MRLSTSVNFLFGEQPFLERFTAAKAAGFEGAEIQILEAGPDDVAVAAQKAGIEIALLNADMGDLLMGGPGMSGVPGREDEFASAIKTAIDAAKTMKAAHIHIGPSRIPDGETRERCTDCLVSNLMALSPLADQAGITLLVEPINTLDMPDALMVSVDETARVLADRLEGRVKLQFDVYHVARNGEDPVAQFNAHGEIVAHVQFSDAPGRGAPGTGDIDFDAVFAALDKAAYSGWVGAEYLPSAGTQASLDWMAKYG